MTGVAGGRVEQLVEPELALQLDLLLLAGVDEADLRADLGREQLDHVVGERLRGRHHLALLQQEPDHVGRGAVQLGPEVLRRRGALDDDRPLGNGSGRRRVARRLHRLQLLAAATPPATPPRRALTAAAGTAAGTAAAAGRATRAARSAAEATAGTAAAATAEATSRAAAATTGRAAGARAATGRTTARTAAARWRGAPTTEAGRGRDGLARHRGGRAGRRWDRLPG
jgi:hypothetical protein